MSIKAKSYEVCKEVQRCGARNQIRELIQGLEPPPPSEEGIDDTDYLSFLARKEHSQVFGYLFIDQERDVIEKNAPIPWKIKPLEEETKSILAGVQFCFQKLNNRCIQEACLDMPQYCKAINPYSQYPAVDLLDVPEIGFLSSDSIDTLASLFKEHPAIQIAIDSKKQFPSEMKEGTEDDFVNNTNKFFQELYTPDVFENPQWFNNMLRSLPVDAPPRIIARHFSALACIKSSISILDQLIYQAIVNDKLPVFSEENIIRVRRRSADNSAIMLDCQLQNLVHFPEPSEIVLVKYTTSYDEVDQLCQIQAVEANIATDFGDILVLQLRGIDDDLNPFKSVLEII